MIKTLCSVAWLLVLGLSSCSEHTDATAEQIQSALSHCGVQIKDYARDRGLDGRYLIMYHKAEQDHERKMECVSSYLETLSVIATGIYPEPTNRKGLY
jgi:hypothetical protein